MDDISKAMNLVPLPSNTSVAPVGEYSKDQADFEFARNNLKRIIDIGEVALDELSSLASQSQHPRAYEAVATLVGQLVAANKEYTDQVQKRVETTESKDKPKNVTNNLVITTAQLQQMLLKDKDAS